MEIKKNENKYELIDVKTGKFKEKAVLEIVQRKRLDAENKIFWERVKAERERYSEETGDISDYEDEYIRQYYKKGYTQTRVDSAKLKKEQPEIFEKYSKEIAYKPTFILELKDGQ